MKTAFKNIAVLGRQHTAGVTETIQLIINYLQQQGIHVVSEEETVPVLGAVKVPIIAREKLKKHCELIIVVGGDGSMLSAAKIAAPQNLPVLGINRGRLGFLADIHPQKIDKIAAILAGEYFEEKRFLLTVEIYPASNSKKVTKKIIETDQVLNDLVIASGNTSKLVEFSTQINDDYVCDYRADGLIVTTPTGSTAYALSGGGPILYPDLEAIAIVPMFSHNLSSRPIVIPSKYSITINISANNSYPLCLSCDGRDRISIAPGSKVHIYRAQDTLRLLHPRDYDYFATLRSKLHWEQ
jgi:NAD+ kinase